MFTLDGSEDTFNELYRRYADDMRSVVYRYACTHLRYELDDICQHFWTGFIRYAHSYDTSRPARKSRPRDQRWGHHVLCDEA